ncbi:MAG: potassium-transporting ATPase subunit KdpB [Vibrio metschnikovii]|uniref:potassium-transporting ATPase subunit KdpB n=1 Tax=Vibrio metschnikovii TaxID=28172 RepID=UPI0016480C3D|nr:potassium-transporting ATPase subunit KdpB [Vibrio metschnikovii]MBC3617781.1 potassium-transporting ATPase subunit KdpB [Vibrio metschnikovii]MBC5813813.1 potassium-transporting ATPase subunit KdpB [Vibrio metschnikovii]MBC5830725.1 potassium-transporting ATPase subunit KdpB [Vibrio metschnikovii]MDM7485996.1 potassium-transporting ATPase subunit KdpB [Vibrio metschnikovii]
MNQSIASNDTYIEWKHILVDSFKKLLPQKMLSNPIMFVVWVGTVLCIGITIHNLVHEKSYIMPFITTLILFFTVWFANLAESVAEAKSRGQAASLRSAKQSLRARRIDGDFEHWVAATNLAKGDRVRVVQGDYIPADGDIVIGVATVNESAITGESAAVLREAGTDHSSVIGGTKLLTGEIIFEVSNDPGHSFLDRMIGLVEGAKRQKTPNEMALTVLLSALTAVFLLTVMTLPAMANFMGSELDYIMLIALLVCLIPTTIGGLLPAIGIAGMNRALKANIVAKSGKAVEVAGDIDTLLIDKTGTITFGDRQATEFLPVDGVTERALIDAAVLASLDDPTPEGKSILSLALSKSIQINAKPKGSEFLPFSPKTRVSGLRLADKSLKLKGASDAIKAWSADKNLSWPQDTDTLVRRVAQKGGTPLVVASNERVLGVVALSDVVKPGVAERFSRLRALGVRTIMVTGDNPITAGVIAAEAGVDDFIAEAKPEDKLALIRQEQAKGRLVAMVGDGTNDAPALAQADVGLAMNSGTQAAKEAGNMVDLDSDPSKLLSVVEVGKQLLITRGALTTFSLANDVAKYFVIIPAIFAGTIPAIGMLDFLRLNSPETAVIAALVFNALIIPALIPLAMKGVKVSVASADKLLRNNMLIYGLGGMVLPFFVIKALDMLIGTLY